MPKLIADWVHRPGRHCASTALSNLMRFYGRDLSEAMCYGLGCGLGFFYLESEALRPSHMIFVRTAELEANCFINLGIDFDWDLSADPEAGLIKAKAAIDRGLPVLIRCDLFHLDYYQTRTHFNAHIVTMWGYDDETRQVFLTDTERTGLLTTGYDTFKEARSSQFPPIPLQSPQFVYDGRPLGRELTLAVPLAIYRQAADMLGVRSGNMEQMWVQGINYAASRAAAWPQAPDLARIARATYQTIAKRGTGGAAFRIIYKEFLEEAEALCPQVKKLKLAAKMAQVGKDWLELGEECRSLSEDESVIHLDKIRACFKRIADQEEAIYKLVLADLRPEGA